MPDEGRRPRVAIVYHYFQHYRSAIFDALAGSKNFDYRFLADTENMYASGVEPWKVPSGTKFERARCRLLPLGWMWQSNIVQLSSRKDVESIIFFGNVYYLATWVCAWLARRRGKRVVFWTQGWLKPEGGIKGWLRRRFYRLADALLVYGHYAKQIGIDNGFSPDQLHVVYNSLDAERQRELRLNIPSERLDAVRRELFANPDRPIVTCVTRLIERRRLDWLLRAVADLRQDGHELNVLLVGDGPARAALESLAAELELDVNFYGPCYDENRIAELNLISAVTAAPGMVGLSAIQSLGYGVPVVTQGDPLTQMPEAEAIIPGVTGDNFVAGDIQELAGVLKRWTQSCEPSPEVREACYRIIDDFYNPESQRRVIERALAGLPADDLGWQPERRRAE